MKTNKAKFTEDDIRRELPPDVFSLLHDLAYLNPHRTSLRQSVISFINGARSLLRKESDGDIDAQLHARELFSIDRCIDRLCSRCEAGEKIHRLEYHKPVRVSFYHRQELENRTQAVSCPADMLHHYRERIESRPHLKDAKKAVLAPEKLAFDRQIPLSKEERRRIGCDCTPVHGDNEHGDCAYRRDLEGRN